MDAWLKSSGFYLLSHGRSHGQLCEELVTCQLDSISYPMAEAMGNYAKSL